ncbi:helix-turn-helix domain-containing protein [Micromonospora haikouensis]|uniref:helix-turn-helix domain-containing protein n=1 Tax=Micromonospora haikouensis TaxID=686309 RepID=UPI0036C3461E
MIDLLTTEQVAALADISRKHVRGWATRRGISSIPGPDGRRAYYPAAPILAVLHPAPHRLARFIRNPLNV